MVSLHLKAIGDRDLEKFYFEKPSLWTILLFFVLFKKSPASSSQSTLVKLDYFDSAGKLSTKYVKRKKGELFSYTNSYLQ